MVNPSDAPKKKSMRKNPELLIVNPYSLGEDRKLQKKRAKMAKKNRRNPLTLRRRNPGFATIKSDFFNVKECLPDGRVVEHEWGNLKNVVLGTAAGGFSLAVGSALIGARFGDSAAGKGLLAVVSGVAGGIVFKMLGDKMNVRLLSDIAVPGATGAMILGLWSLIQAPVENAASTVLHGAGVPGTTAGWGAWTKEFDGLGQSYYDEFTKGVAPGMSGLGQPVVAAADMTDPSHNPFLHGYEPLGDIYNTQRLGSFEAESGLGAFTAENANPRDQQVADVMKNASGAYGGYEGSPFDPFVES